MYSIDTYQYWTRHTIVYPPTQPIEYLTLGLSSEAGEVAAIIKRWIRDETPTDVVTKELEKELGDVLWYVARLADEAGLSLQAIIEGNKRKLEKRQLENKLKGKGDDR